MQATLYLISQTYVSGRSLRAVMDGLCAKTQGRAEAVRLERDGEHMWQALSRLRAEGVHDITLRPVGLPFSQSLMAWLPGAAGEWLARAENSDCALWLAEDCSADDDVLSAIAQAPQTRTAIEAKLHGSNGNGWDAPPAHRHHILVCSGPRCHLRDAPDLLGMLKAEINRLGIGDDCLVTSTGCMFPCNSGPNVVVYPQANWFRLTDASAVRRFADVVLRQNSALPELHNFKTGARHDIS